MQDVCFALKWFRHTLPKIRLKRSDFKPNGDRIVAIGWSTGGHLAMTLPWTAPAAGIAPPDAILAFYCPTDYEDPFWTLPNIPYGATQDSLTSGSYDLWEGVYESPITAYNPPASARALGGWMAPSDARSRICLHMNRKAQTLPILIQGLKKQQNAEPTSEPSVYSSIPTPTLEQIKAVSPLAQIKAGAYRTPTHIVHGTRDDLIPWQQAQRTYEALQEKGVRSGIRILDGAVHLFDLYKNAASEGNDEAVEAIREGYQFLIDCTRH